MTWDALLEWEEQNYTSDFRIAVEGECVGTLIQGTYTGELSLFASTQQECDELLDGLDFRGNWSATARRRYLDMSKAPGQRFVREEFYRGIGAFGPESPG